MHKSMELIGLNTKWHRYQNKITQEKLAEKTKFKVAYISLLECGRANTTCSNIDIIAKALNVKQSDLFNEETANKAKNLPNRIDKYYTK